MNRPRNYEDPLAEGSLNDPPETIREPGDVLDGEEDGDLEVEEDADDDSFGEDGDE